jgi:hypothetical protein
VVVASEQINLILEEKIEKLSQKCGNPNIEILFLNWGHFYLLN